MSLVVPVGVQNVAVSICLLRMFWQQQKVSIALWFDLLLLFDKHWHESILHQVVERVPYLLLPSQIIRQSVPFDNVVFGYQKQAYWGLVRRFSVTTGARLPNRNDKCPCRSRTVTTY